LILRSGSEESAPVDHDGLCLILREEGVLSSDKQSTDPHFEAEMNLEALR
jgi:hypothetical protein